MYKNVLFFGAQSFALSMCNAIKKVYPECVIEGFLVTSLVGNPYVLNGLPVKELSVYAETLSEEERLDRHILIATPEDLHLEIIVGLERYGFRNYICMDSVKEARLMEKYFSLSKELTVLHNLPMQSKKMDIKLKIIQTKFFKDKLLKCSWELPEWVMPLQVGTALTEVRVAELVDNQGDNISLRNGNYCELTGLYWLWKNGLTDECAYYGLFHYRRILDISEEDLSCLKTNDIDVILPFPTMHEPNIKEHHKRYINEVDWQAMRQALGELRPEYAEAYDEIFGQRYFYNYNMLVAKKQILENYCTWLFPVLERIEELSNPRGWERSDRYMGYIGENLLTLYFMYHRNDLNIVHTGRLMLT